MGEGAGLLVQDLGDPDDHAVLVVDRRAKDRSGEEPGLTIESRIEAEVGVGMRDVERLSEREGLAGDAKPRREADLVEIVAHGHPREEGLGRGVVDEDGRPLRTQHLGGLGHHALQQARQVELLVDLGDQIDEFQLLLP